MFPVEFCVQTNYWKTTMRLALPWYHYSKMCVFVCIKACYNILLLNYYNLHCTYYTQ